MLAAAGDFRNSGVFCVLAVLTTVFTVSFSPALTSAMCTFFVVCHWNTLLSLKIYLVSMLGPVIRIVKQDQSLRGAHYNRPLLVA